MQKFQLGDRVETREVMTHEKSVDRQYPAGLTGTVTDIRQTSVRWSDYPTRTSASGEREAYDDNTNEWHETDGWEIMYAVAMDFRPPASPTMIMYQYQLKAETPIYEPSELIA